MNKTFKFCLMAALVCGLGLTSCDKELSPEEKAALQEEQSTEFWNVVGQLVSSEDYTEDYANATFEPMYGNEDPSNPLARVVNLNTMESAASSFGYLVGADITESTNTYTYKNDNVGTLIYNKVDDGDVWATVDVSIKQIPHLEKIIYKVPGGGENGSFGYEKAYFRFGDIVKRDVKDGDTYITEYWICVRPAFTYEKKEDSHWVCLNILPKNNLYHRTGNQYITFDVPTGLGTDKNRMQDFAEMLYAICHPSAWQSNVMNNYSQGLKMFTDFDGSKYLKYHNEFFWKNVQEAWKHLDQTSNDFYNAFLMTYKTVQECVDGTDGIHLMYNGKNWYPLSWTCTLYEAAYQNGSEAKTKNMHKVTFTKPSKDIGTCGYSLDFSVMGVYGAGNYLEFFGNDGIFRWPIRHLTGHKLNGKTLSATTGFSAGSGITEVYRYYSYYPDEWNYISETNGGPEVTRETSGAPSVGDILAVDGNFYDTKEKAVSEGGGAVAIVVCANGDKRVEKGADWNGLAIAINPIKSDNLAFGSQNYSNCPISTVSEVKDGVTVLNGIASTKTLADGCSQNHVHPIAREVQNYQPAASLSKQAMSSGKFSAWFIPSVGQWIMALKSLGLPFDDVKGLTEVLNDNDDFSNQALDFLEARGWKGSFYDFYHSSTLSNYSASAHVCQLGLDDFTIYDAIHLKYHYFDLSMTTQGNGVCPFIAFKYNSGASSD